MYVYCISTMNPSIVLFLYCSWKISNPLQNFFIYKMNTFKTLKSPHKKIKPT